MARPNFLFIVTDQHRADHLGCYGHPVLHTPHIDAIAAAGTRYEEFHVASPVCMPNRASLLTGRYPSAHGLRANGHILSWRANTFVDVLKAEGYRTAHLGKSHVQPMTNQPPQAQADPAALGLIQEAWKDDGGDYTQEQPHHYAGSTRYDPKTPFYGFDEVDFVTQHGDQAGAHYLQWLRERTPDADRLRQRANQLAHDYICPQAYRTPIPEALYPTSYIRDRAVEFLASTAGADQPFFAFVSFPDPHHPFTPPGRYWDMYDPRSFKPPLPFEAHRNPPPPLRWSQQQALAGRDMLGPQDSFFASEREIREAMALTCGMITMIDDAVGDILAALRRSGRYEDTVVVFTSDHGDYLGDFGMMLKGALAMRSINRVPFIWSDPRQREARISHALGSTIDIAPTVLQRAGVTPYFGIQGHSLLDTLDGQTPAPRDALLIEYQDSKTRQGFTRPACVRTLVTQSHRLSLYKGQDWGELYDRRADPGETCNLWQDAASATERLRMTDALAHAMMDAIDRSPRARFAA